MNRPTLGPWLTDPSPHASRIYGPDGKAVAFTDRRNPRHVENRRLIAAAPETVAERDRLKAMNADLLAALEYIAALSVIDGTERGGAWLRRMSDAGNRARTAIAKAEGRS